MASVRTDVVIYHNPRCSKSRAALALLRERGIEPVVVEYLRTPLDVRALAELLQRLALPASAVVRRSEDVMQEVTVRDDLSEDEWLAALAAHPQLLQRPIVVCGDRGVLARPPERVLELL